MLRLAANRDSIGAVDDQIGNPTSALDIADAAIRIAARLIGSQDEDLRGVFHLTGTGAASWADLAKTIFDLAAVHGGPTASVRRITTAEYPTPARRPANSRLDCTKLERVHHLRLPDWRLSLPEIVSRLLEKSN